MTKQCRGGETNAKEKLKLFIRFWWPYPDFDTLRRTSRLILRREPLFALDSTRLGSCLISFATQCAGIPIPRKCESQCLDGLAHALHPGASPSTTDLTQLFGHLFLTVIPRRRDDPFPVYIDRESRSLISVMKGCYDSIHASVVH
jgi:hypothetical protein